jgi:3-deoxy-D-manno-octulosonic acid (KDO) 8-phosphate synthase
MPDTPPTGPYNDATRYSGYTPETPEPRGRVITERTRQDRRRLGNTPQRPIHTHIHHTRRMRRNQHRPHATRRVIRQTRPRHTSKPHTRHRHNTNPNGNRTIRRRTITQPTVKVGTPRVHRTIRRQRKASIDLRGTHARRQLHTNRGRGIRTAIRVLRQTRQRTGTQLTDTVGTPRVHRTIRRQRKASIDLRGTHARRQPHSDRSGTIRRRTITQPTVKVGTPRVHRTIRRQRKTGITTVNNLRGTHARRQLHTNRGRGIRITIRVLRQTRQRTGTQLTVNVGTPRVHRTIRRQRKAIIDLRGTHARRQPHSDRSGTIRRRTITQPTVKVGTPRVHRTIRRQRKTGITTVNNLRGTHARRQLHTNRGRGIRITIRVLRQTRQRTGTQLTVIVGAPRVHRTIRRQRRASIDLRGTHARRQPHSDRSGTIRRRTITQLTAIIGTPRVHRTIRRQRIDTPQADDYLRGTHARRQLHTNRGRGIRITMRVLRQTRQRTGTQLTVKVGTPRVHRTIRRQRIVARTTTNTTDYRGERDPRRWCDGHAGAARDRPHLWRQREPPRRGRCRAHQSPTRNHDHDGKQNTHNPAKQTIHNDLPQKNRKPTVKWTGFCSRCFVGFWGD